jgi:hypothetical protein
MEAAKQEVARKQSDSGSSSYDEDEGDSSEEEVFLSILSSIIKIAHFMVVLKAEQVTGEICEEEWAAIESPCMFDDSGYESEQPQRPPKRRRGTRSSF